MDTNEMKMKIDAEKFAFAVVSSNHIDGNSNEEIAKRQLVLYLTSYFLAENFNNMENQYFENMEEKDYEEFMLKLSGLRAFR